MSLYAIIGKYNEVTAFISPPDGEDVQNSPHLTKAQKASLVLVPDALDLTVAVGWKYHPHKNFFEPPGGIPPVQPSDQAQQMLHAGLTIVSESRAAVDGTYDCSMASQVAILAEVVSLMNNKTFADGSTTLQWPDLSGTEHPFSPAVFIEFSTVMGRFISTLVKIRRTNTGSFPSSTTNIQ